MQTACPLVGTAFGVQLAAVFQDLPLSLFQVSSQACAAAAIVANVPA